MCVGGELVATVPRKARCCVWLPLSWMLTPAVGNARSGNQQVLERWESQELISVLESFSFPPLGHGKTKARGAGRAPGAAGLGFRAGAGLCSQGVGAAPTEGDFLEL